MRIKLSPAFVANAKCEPGKDRSFYWDESLPQFGLQVTDTGARSFVCQYRQGRQSRRMKISAALRLSEARKEAHAILGKVAKGGDPLAERRQKEAAATNTLQSVCESYFAREGKKLRTVGERQTQLKRLVYPRLGSRQIDDVKRSDLVRLLDKVEDENGPVMADRTLAYLRRVFSWHAARSDEFRSPVTRGMARTKPKERARSRVLSDDELRAVWKATGDMQKAFGPLVRFILLTATRLREAAHTQRSELDGGLWVIPASRYKGNHDHVVPMSKAAKAVIDALPVVDGSKWIFSHDGKRPVGGFSKFKARLEKASGTSGWTLHDLRRTARSLMSRAGVPTDHAERALGHVINGVRGTYDRHEYLAEKKAAFEAVAEQIRRIISPPGDNVVELRGAQ
jgi:integrase